MTVRDEQATMTSSTGREADDTLGKGESSHKTAKVAPWICCKDGNGATTTTVVAATDIPADITAGPYPGGLDFAARTSDHPTVGSVVKVVWRQGRLSAENDEHIVTNHSNSKLHLASSGRKTWMVALQPARDRHEQNLEVLTEGGRLVLHVLKPISRGERLLLWYSDALARTFGVPILTPAHIRGNQQYTCTACNITFQYPNTLKAHILFRCEAASSSSRSPSLMSPSAFTTTTSLPQFCLSGSSFSAFHRSPTSVKLITAARDTSTRQNCSMALFTRRKDRESSGLASLSKYEQSGRKTVLERRTMTPDSSIGESSVLNLSMRKSLCSSSFSLPIPVCSSVQLSPSQIPSAANLSGITSQPIQIFNHIHPPAFPAFSLPLDQHMALKLCYPWLTTLPESSPTKLLCSSVPASTTMLDPQHHFSFHHSPNRNLLFPQYFSSECSPQSLLVSSAPKPRPPSCDSILRNIPSTRVSPDTVTGNIINSSLMAASHPSSSSKSHLPLLPMPSEKEGEPLDLLPPSFFANKSRKGHLCIYCGKLYSRKYGLKIHLRTHTGYKPLKCKVCLRPFGDPSNLNKHVRLHAEGETPYRCAYCGKVLVRRRDLERHIRSRHPSDVSMECIDSDVDVTSGSESIVGNEQEIEVA